jgi:hypothetical protein
MTLAPASLESIDIKRGPKEDRREWSLRLATLVEPLGYGTEPPVVLLHVHPPNLSAHQLQGYIRQDGGARRSMWDLSKPISLVSGTRDIPAAAAASQGTSDHHVESSQDQEAKQQGLEEAMVPEEEEQSTDPIPRGMETLKARFIVACADEAEARRFQRAWNQRVLQTGSGQSHVIQASIVT